MLQLIKLKKINYLRTNLNHQLRYLTKNADLFGIKEVSSRDVMGTKEITINEEEFEKKYSFVSNLKRLDNEEKIIDFPHASIRFDKDNLPKYHGQFDEDNEKAKYDIESIEELIIKGNDKDDLNKTTTTNSNNEFTNKDVKFSQLKEKIKKEEKSMASLIDDLDKNKDYEINLNQSKFVKKPPFNPNKPFRIKVDISNVDIYDFGPIKKDYQTAKLTFNFNQTSDSTNFKFSTQWSNWIERDILLANSPLANVCSEERLLFSEIDLRNKYGNLKSNVINEKETNEDLYSPLKSINQISEELKELSSNNKLEEEDEDNEEKENKSMNISHIFKEDTLKIYNQEKKEKFKNNEMKYDEEEEEEEVDKKEDKVSLKELTALEYLRKVKNREVKIENKELNKSTIKNSIKSTNSSSKKEFKPDKMEFDSKGFKNFKYSATEIYKLNNVDRALYLESELIFNNNGICVINKPYGLICLGDKEFTQLIAIQDRSVRKDNSFDDFNNPILYPIYKLDKDCTGVYILAKNKETARRVHELFKNRNVSLFYEGITKNVPNLEKATIDIPIEMNYNDLKYKRMVLKPIVPDEYKLMVKESKTADKAITNYKVLKSYKHACHIELNPLTSVRHQLRAHLGLALRTPLLGDHLYDNEKFVSYQKLPIDMLLNLNIRPTKTMHIPLHLHCKMIILNQFARNERDFFLKADLPHFFKENLKSLKLVNKE